MRCHACYMDLPAAQVDKEEDIIGHEPAPGPHLRGEKVRGHQYIHMRVDELLPGRALLAFGSGWDPVSFQDIVNGLLTDRIAEMGQGADHTSVPPGPILSGQ